MRAAVIGTDHTAPPVRVREVPDPVTKAGWVTVSLRAAALNRLDAMLLEHRTSEAPGTIFGADGAGVIAHVGPGVDGWSPGDPVVVLPSLFWGPDPAAPGPDYEILGSPSHGTHAELVTVPVDNVFPVPPHLSWEQAAALPLAGVTAWRALVTRGGLRTGETVAVAAASSGVGSLAIQIAAAHGARVIAVTSGQDKAAQARALGADEVLDRSSSDLGPTIMDLTDGVGTDLALDPSGALVQDFIDGSRPGGRIVVVGKMASPTAVLGVQSIYWKQVDIRGSSMGSPHDFTSLLAHVEQRGWAPKVDSEFSLDDIERAYRRLDAPQRVGKVVVRINREA